MESVFDLSRRIFYGLQPSLMHEIWHICVLIMNLLLLKVIEEGTLVTYTVFYVSLVSIFLLFFMCLRDVTNCVNNIWIHGRLVPDVDVSYDSTTDDSCDSSIKTEYWWEYFCICIYRSRISAEALWLLRGSLRPGLRELAQRTLVLAAAGPWRFLFVPTVRHRYKVVVLKRS